MFSLDRFHELEKDYFALLPFVFCEKVCFLDEVAVCTANINGELSSFI